LRARRLTAPSEMPSRRAASRWFRPSASRSCTSVSQFDEEAEQGLGVLSFRACGECDAGGCALRTVHRVARVHECRPARGADIGRQGLLHQADPDPHAPGAQPGELQDDLEGAGGIGDRGLDLVACGPFGGERESRAGRSGDRVQAGGDEVVAHLTVSLVRRHHEHGRSFCLGAEVSSV
jgi:hypothetical protein